MTSQNCDLSNVPNLPLAALATLMQAEADVDFAVLVGSQAHGMAHPGSDWDIALQWAAQVDWVTTLSRGESLRHRIADALGLPDTKIDLIDLRRANLAMRASVAEDGIPLSGDNTVQWVRFLRRTWRELEDFYWDKQHAA
ncbi:MAG: hypothetical protein RLZZ591_2578 [Pseudomonadota bacterium]|jgi:predicted nucleotidyltransferase